MCLAMSVGRFTLKRNYRTKLHWRMGVASFLPLQSKVPVRIPSLLLAPHKQLIAGMCRLHSRDGNDTEDRALIALRKVFSQCSGDRKFQACVKGKHTKKILEVGAVAFPGKGVNVAQVVIPGGERDLEETWPCRRWDVVKKPRDNVIVSNVRDAGDVLRRASTASKELGADVLERPKTMQIGPRFSYPVHQQHSIRHKLIPAIGTTIDQNGSTRELRSVSGSGANPESSLREVDVQRTSCNSRCTSEDANQGEPEKGRIKWRRELRHSRMGLTPQVSKRERISSAEIWEPFLRRSR
ncbi:hypothetical protein B0H14DRAFT_3787561 [Mycena olivaceomarginata]|nr:hypothetical protein B0H14DRAFT_3787561 [Mycena olivaceomarginata]